MSEPELEKHEMYLDLEPQLGAPVGIQIRFLFFFDARSRHRIHANILNVYNLIILVMSTMKVIAFNVESLYNVDNYLEYLLMSITSNFNVGVN